MLGAWLGTQVSASRRHPGKSVANQIHQGSILMKMIAIALGAIIGSVAFASPADAAKTSGNSAVASTASAEQARRSELVVSIVEKWGPHVEEAYRRPAAAWSDDMLPLLTAVPLDTLQKAANAGSFTEMNAILAAKPVAGVRRPLLSEPAAIAAVPKVSGSSARTFRPDAFAKALGDDGVTLTYIPLEPCRLFDTRVAGGPIQAMTSRAFDISNATDYVAQGGSATDCNGLGAVGDFAAAAVTFTVVEPAQRGYITVYPTSAPRPFAATIAYSAGALSTATSLVKLDQGANPLEFTVYANSTAHVVGDVVGIFIQNKATATECTATFTSQVVAANDVFDIEIPSCPVGYALTGAGCRTPGFDEANWAINGLFYNGSEMDAFCSGVNKTAGSISVEGSAQCCRVPGR